LHLKTSEENSNYNKLVQKEGKGQGTTIHSNDVGLDCCTRGSRRGGRNKQQLEDFKIAVGKLGHGNSNLPYPAVQGRRFQSEAKPEYRLLIVKCLENLGFERKTGKPPATAMERELQKWLESYVK